MTELLGALLGEAPELVAQFFLVFLRISAAIFVLPVFGESMIPMRVRLAAALAFSFIAFPAVVPLMDSDTTEMKFIASGAAELLTGLLIGMMLRLQVMAIQIAASIAAQSTSLAQLLGNSGVDPQPAIGLVLYLAALALAVELGLHVQVALMFIASFQLIAPGTLLDTGIAATIRDAISVSFRFGLILAAPFVAVSLLYNLALGVINRAMPQLMVAFVGAPAITFAALLLLALTAPLILSVWVDAFQTRLSNPLEAR